MLSVGRNSNLGKLVAEINSGLAKSDIWERRSCPLCASNDFSVKPEVQAKSPAESMSWNEVRDSFVGLRKDQLFFSYYRCSKCNLLYCPWYFSAPQLEELYSQMPDNLMGEDKSTASKTQSGYVRWILAKTKTIDSFLEIGPDVGLVTSAIVKSVRPAKIGLIEPNLAVHTDLRKSAGSTQQVEIVQELNQLKSSGYQLAVGIHVFDHLLNPLADLKKLGQLSRDGANLGVVVHNEGSLLRKIISKKWPPFCLQHPQLYNRETLRTMLLAGGWNLETVNRSKNYFHLNHLAKLALGIFGLPEGLSKFIPKFETPVNLGNMISMATLIS